LSDNHVEREKRMISGINHRRNTDKIDLLFGDSDTKKGEEFINMMKDYYHDDADVIGLLDKLKHEDIKQLSHM